jgi:hypothetical protein
VGSGGIGGIQEARVWHHTGVGFFAGTKTPKFQGGRFADAEIRLSADSEGGNVSWQALGGGRDRSIDNLNLINPTIHAALSQPKTCFRTYACCSPAVSPGEQGDRP